MGRPPCRQSGEFDPETGRPLCQHGEPMRPKNGKDGAGFWRCAVRQREADSAYSKTMASRVRNDRYNMTPGRQSKEINYKITSRLRAAGVEV